MYLVDNYSYTGFSRIVRAKANSVSRTLQTTIDSIIASHILLHRVHGDSPLSMECMAVVVHNNTKYY